MQLRPFTQLWAIMLRNATDVFLTQMCSRKFIDALEDVLTNSRTNQVVRERLLEVLAAAVFITSSRTCLSITDFILGYSPFLTTFQYVYFLICCLFTTYTYETLSSPLQPNVLHSSEPPFLIAGPSQVLILRPSLNHPLSHLKIATVTKTGFVPYGCA